jgi:two-component sensor histidine kinase
MRPLLMSVGVFSLGCILCGALAIRDSVLRAESALVEHESLADRYAADLSRKLATYETFARLSAATFQPQDPFDPEALTAFAGRVLGLIPNAYSMVWGVRVSPSERPLLIDALARKNATLFGPTAGDVPPPDEVLYVNLDIEPPTGPNLSSVGLALNSRPQPKAAIEKAVESNRPVATSPLRLIQNPSEPALIIYGPVSVNGRLLGVLGFSFLFSELMPSPLPANTTLTIVDAAATSFGPVFQAGPPSEASAVTRTITFAGRDYLLRLQVHSENGLVQSGLSIFGFGVTIALLLALLTFSILRNNVALQAALSSKEAAEKVLQTIVGELNHRVRNTCAMAIALARQSFKETPEAFAEFQGRLSALAAGLGSSETAELRAMAEEVTRSFRTNVDVSGREIKLSFAAAQLLPLAIHELMTNSLKHGALGKDQRVILSWDLQADTFRLTWTELQTGGPQIESNTIPARRSFGTQLLARLIPQQLGGQAELGWHEGKYRYDLIVPSKSVTDAALARST